MSARAHSRCGGSVLARRITCTASLLLEDEIEEEPDDEASAEVELARQEGTRAHALLEACVLQNIDAADYVPLADNDPVLRPGSDVVELEMLHFVQEAIDLVGDVVPPDRRHEILCELTVPFGSWCPDPEGAFGTADLVWYDREHKTLYLWDLKYGFMRVDGKVNVQMRAYALAVLEYLEQWFDVEIEWVDMTIVQPRLGIDPGFARMTPMELEGWADEVVRPGIFEALDCERRQFAPSADNCRYCRARNACKARASIEHATDTPVAAIVKGQAFRYRDKELMSDATLAALVPHLDSMIAWAKDCRKYVSREVLDGRVTVPGYGHVTRLGNRKWRAGITAEDIRKTLGLADAKVHERKLLGPAAIEKLLPKKKAAPELHEKLAACVERSEGPPSFTKLYQDDTVIDPTEGFDALQPNETSETSKA